MAVFLEIRGASKLVVVLTIPFSITIGCLVFLLLSLRIGSLFP